MITESYFIFDVWKFEPRTKFRAPSVFAKMQVMIKHSQYNIFLWMYLYKSKKLVLSHSPNVQCIVFTYTWCFEVYMYLHCMYMFHVLNKPCRLKDTHNFARFHYITYSVYIIFYILEWTYLYKMQYWLILLYFTMKDCFPLMYLLQLHIVTFVCCLYKINDFLLTLWVCC